MGKLYLGDAMTRIRNQAGVEPREVIGLGGQVVNGIRVAYGNINMTLTPEHGWYDEDAVNRFIEAVKPR